MAETATQWVLDPMHSEVQFKIKHLVISTVTGAFKTFSGTMESDGEGIENARVSVSIDISSIDTNNEMRDGHLKGGEFFDAEQFPTIKFVSTGFTKKDDDNYELNGHLTIRDVTKPVTLAVDYGGQAADFYGNTKAGFEATGKISRKEFGLVWNGITEAGSIVLGDEVKLIVNAQFAKQA